MGSKEWQTLVSLLYGLTMVLIRVLSIFVVVGGVLAVDKQIKLEDIEKDNLKADQQAKYEKQYQAFQQYQAYQQPGLNYQQQPSIAYQPAYQQQQQYVVPSQQYLQQALYQNYQGSNGIAAYQQPAAPSHPFQNYFSQQLQQVPVPGSQTHTQPQGVIMAYSAPSLAAFQQQAAAYYQNIAPGAQVPQYYFPQQQQDASPVPAYTPQQAAYSPQQVAYSPQQVAYSPQQMTYNPQQYVHPLQSIGSVRAPTGVQYSENSISTPFATASPYTSQAYTQSQEVQNYLKQSAASQGQQKQYLQAVNPVSTVSPLQSKYINSPQYLAQNYNTIPSTYLLPKAAYSGVKATPAPSAKIATQGGFVPLNPLSSASTNYQNYRSISG